MALATRVSRLGKQSKTAQAHYLVHIALLIIKSLDRTWDCPPIGNPSSGVISSTASTKIGFVFKYSAIAGKSTQCQELVSGVFSGTNWFGLPSFGLWTIAVNVTSPSVCPLCLWMQTTKHGACHAIARYILHKSAFNVKHFAPEKERDMRGRGEFVFLESNY